MKAGLLSHRKPQINPGGPKADLSVRWGCRADGIRAGRRSMPTKYLVGRFCPKSASLFILVLHHPSSQSWFHIQLYLVGACRRRCTEEMYLVGACAVALLHLGPAGSADRLFHRVLQILDVTTRFLLSLAGATLHLTAQPLFGPLCLNEPSRFKHQKRDVDLRQRPNSQHAFCPVSPM